MTNARANQIGKDLKMAKTVSFVTENYYKYDPNSFDELTFITDSVNKSIKIIDSKV